MKTVVLLASLLLAACAHIPENTIPRPVPGPESLQADYVTYIGSSDEWAHTVWYRVGDSYDIAGFFVVSMNGDICLHKDGSWAIAHHGELFRCPGGWRPKSTVGMRGTKVPMR